MTIFCRYATMDLAYCFLKWSPVGIYSSIVFLEEVEEYKSYIEDRHWRFSLFDKNRSECQKLFKVFGMDFKPLAVNTLGSKNNYKNAKGSKHRYDVRPRDGNVQ
jgi:hypothetical protein